MSDDKLLGLLAADSPDCRVELVQVAQNTGAPTLELRFQRHCGDLGWQTQRRIRLAAGQIPDLRAALNMMDPDARDRASSAHDRGSARAIRLVADNSPRRQSS